MASKANRYPTNLQEVKRALKNSGINDVELAEKEEQYVFIVKGQPRPISTRIKDISMLTTSEWVEEANYVQMVQ